MRALRCREQRIKEVLVLWADVAEHALVEAVFSLSAVICGDLPSRCTSTTSMLHSTGRASSSRRPGCIVKGRYYWDSGATRTGSRRTIGALDWSKICPIRQMD